MIRVLLVEDLTLSRAGVRALLQTSEKIEVVGEAANGREAIKLAKKLNPDVILMDVAMPEMNGIEATRTIHAEQPHIRVLMLSMHSNRQYLFESLQAGAAGFVPKDVAFAELLSAIHAVVANGTYLSPPLAHMVMDDYFRRAQGKNEISELAVLSGREREVLQLIAEGNSSSEIAQAMHISARTVDTHRHNIMKKLDIHSIAGLTKFAIRNGLCSL
jgi:two-component system, NarL family, response regulator NreC